MGDTTKLSRRAGIRPLCPIHFEEMSGSADETLEFYSCPRHGCDLHWRSASDYFRLSQGQPSQQPLEHVLCTKEGHGHKFIARRSGSKAIWECPVEGCLETEERPLPSKSQNGISKELTQSVAAGVPSEKPRFTYDREAKNGGPATKKRPGWVWVISVWYTISFVLASVLAYLTFSGLIPMTPQFKAYIGGLTAIDYIFTIIQPLLSVSAAVALFLLRRQATYLFWSLLAVGVASHVWQYDLRSGISGAHSMPGGSPGAFFAMGVQFAICIYVENLKRRSTLS
jgi:hypothetical protein